MCLLSDGCFPLAPDCTEPRCCYCLRAARLIGASSGSGEERTRCSWLRSVPSDSCPAKTLGGVGNGEVIRGTEFMFLTDFFFFLKINDKTASKGRRAGLAPLSRPLGISVTVLMFCIEAEAAERTWGFYAHSLGSVRRYKSSLNHKQRLFFLILSSFLQQHQLFQKLF